MTIYKTEDKPFPDKDDPSDQYVVYAFGEWLLAIPNVNYWGSIEENRNIYGVTHWMLLEKPKDWTMKNRTTPDNITELGPNEIFVFGSNLSGRHGRGAAKTALQWGAKWGQASGIQGKTYGIPTKDASICRTLSIEEIEPFVSEFIEYAKQHTGNTFLVTEVGCGLAGYSPKDIAPLFVGAVLIENICLPKKFWGALA